MTELTVSADISPAMVEKRLATLPVVDVVGVARGGPASIISGRLSAHSSSCFDKSSVYPCFFSKESTISAADTSGASVPPKTVNLCGGKQAVGQIKRSLRPRQRRPSHYR